MADVRIISKDELRKELAEYLQENEDAFFELLEELDNWDGYLNGDRWYPMYELDELLYGKTPLEVLNCVSSDFNVNDEYFKDGIYGLESSDYVDYSDYEVDDAIDELINEYPHITMNDGTVETAIEALINDYEFYEVDDEYGTIEGVEDEDEE